MNENYSISELWAEFRVDVTNANDFFLELGDHRMYFTVRMPVSISNPNYNWLHELVFIYNFPDQRQPKNINIYD